MFQTSFASVMAEDFQQYSSVPAQQEAVYP